MARERIQLNELRKAWNSVNNQTKSKIVSQPENKWSGMKDCIKNVRKTNNRGKLSYCFN